MTYEEQAKYLMSLEDITVSKNSKTAHVKEEAQRPTFGSKLEELFGDKFIIKSAKIRKLLGNQVEVQKVKGGNFPYKFKVEGHNGYALVAQQMQTGIYWIKESKSQW